LEITEGFGNFGSLGQFVPIFAEGSGVQTGPPTDWNLRSREGLRGRWDTIFPKTSRGINSNASVRFVSEDEDFIDALIGKTIRLMDGQTVIREAEITEATILFENLPVGVYYVSTGDITDSFYVLRVTYGTVNVTVIEV
jgi:hypothetical protein